MGDEICAGPDPKMQALLKELSENPDVRVEGRQTETGEWVYWSTDPRRDLCLVIQRYAEEGC